VIIMDSYEKMLKEAKKKLPELKSESGRLEIQPVSVQVIGRQTIVKNFVTITKAIRREPKLVAKYLFKELAVPGDLRQNELVLL